ncbi:MAG: hypothetical protein AAFY06_17100 [Pseudomonadota bacterium]
MRPNSSTQPFTKDKARNSQRPGCGAPESERDGVETYSKLWGPKRAVIVWLGFVVIAAALLIGVGLATGIAFWLALLAALGVGVCAWAGVGYAAAPTVAAEKRVDTLAGLWVFLCYASAGFVPLVLGGAG